MHKQTNATIIRDAPSHFCASTLMVLLNILHFHSFWHCDFCENAPWKFKITVKPFPHQNSCGVENATWNFYSGYTRKWIHHLLFTNERFSKLLDSGKKTWCYQVSFYACKGIKRRSWDLDFLCGLMLPSIKVPTSYPDPIIFDRSSLNGFIRQPSDGLLLGLPRFITENCTPGQSSPGRVPGSSRLRPTQI